ncbi:MAG: hypothetical protein ABSG91_24785 [Syntrophobacteraceae bacterium]
MIMFQVWSFRRIGNFGFNDKRDLLDNPLQCLLHRLHHNRLHLIRYVISDFDYYFIMPGTDNADIKAVQFLGNINQGQFKPIGAYA